MTIEFKVNCFVPVDKGELTGLAEIIHKSSHTAVGVAEVINESGKLVAKVMATYGIKKIN